MRFPPIRLIDGVGHLPISFQIKNSLKHAISSGHLLPNAQLPSVRDLADHLAVAANTVARAYKELQDDGLLVTYLGRGTFVADLVENAGSSDDKHETLLTILRPAVTSARAVGFTLEEVRACAAELFVDHTVHAGLVGINEVVVAKWKRILEEEYADLGVAVTALTVAQVQDDFEAAMRLLAPCFHIFSLITTYAETRLLFRGQNKHIVALITEVSMATHQALAALPADETVGLVCEDIYVNNLVGLIAPYVDLTHVERVSPDDTAALCALLARRTHILHTLSPRARVAQLAHPENHLIEIEFLPNRSCFEQIRQILLKAAEPV
jgi:GntR family transcriptional regulator